MQLILASEYAVTQHWKTTNTNLKGSYDFRTSVLTLRLWIMNNIWITTILLVYQKSTKDYIAPFAFFRFNCFTPEKENKTVKPAINFCRYNVRLFLVISKNPVSEILACNSNSR